MAEEVGRSGADAPSGHSAKPEPCSTVSAVPASVPNAIDFITFTTVDGREEATVRLNGPVCLFDETDRGYRAARARASRRIKVALGMHPCAKLAVVPHDWSDAIDALSERRINA